MMDSEMKKGLGYILEELLSVNSAEESDEEIINLNDSLEKLLTPLEKSETKSKEIASKSSITHDDEEEFSLSQIECPNNSNLSCNSESICSIVPGSVSSLGSTDIESIKSLNTRTIGYLQITNADLRKANEVPKPNKNDERGKHLIKKNPIGEPRIPIQTRKKRGKPLINDKNTAVCFAEGKRKRGRPRNNEKTKLDAGKMHEKELNKSTISNLLPRVVLHDLNICQQKSDIETVQKKEDSFKKLPNKSVKFLYSRGAVVWAKVPGYSFWPAMIDDDPDYKTYYWTQGISSILTHYHVVFFDTKDRLSRSWVKPNNVKPFVEIIKVNNKRHSAHLERFKTSIKSAKEAAMLSVHERLKKFSFKTRMKSPSIKLCQD